MICVIHKEARTEELEHTYLILNREMIMLVKTWTPYGQQLMSTYNQQKRKMR